MRKTAFIVGLAMMLSVSLGVLAQADCGKANCAKKQCPISKSDGQKCAGKKAESQKECQCPITAKFMKKAHFILENKEALELTDEQIEQVYALKVEVKKSYIMQKAGMEVMMIDIMSKMRGKTVDVEGINALIDEGSAKMAAGIKSTIASYAELKGLLTEKQMGKLKEIWSKKK
ncbi:MAG: hypothetical protein Q8Q33_06185 [Chlamydiota bacterium]|nr:hypothetical protein [Chlamydiota bacterium]